MAVSSTVIEAALENGGTQRNYVKWSRVSPLRPFSV